MRYCKKNICIMKLKAVTKQLAIVSNGISGHLMISRYETIFSNPIFSAAFLLLSLTYK